tara:strand:+ start:800 stop:1018 length:219 start_codon:yes stop_codon:yes gene_type:complete
MKYAGQIQGSLDRLDQSLKRLHTMIKRGENANAIRFMEEGALKDCYEELQNLITISQTGNLGAMGTTQTGTL